MSDRAPIHRTAAVGFDRGAEVYERARPGYPAAAVEHLIDVLRLREAHTVVDLAAGTGKLTKELLARGIACIAIEPVAGMREQLGRVLPGARVLDGTAEALPLQDASVDAVTVAQAFHWFRPEEALAELARVMRRRARLGLVWNVRDTTVDWVRRVTEIIDPHEGDVRIPRYRDRGWRPAFARTAAFAAAGEAEFRHEQPMTPEGLVERVLSVSFIASLDRPARDGVVSQVRELCAEHPQLRGRSSFAHPYVTEVYVYERA